MKVDLEREYLVGNASMALLNGIQKRDLAVTQPRARWIFSTITDSRGDLVTGATVPGSNVDDNNFAPDFGFAWADC